MFEVLKDFGVLLPLIILSPQTLQAAFKLSSLQTLKWAQIGLLK